VLGRLPLAFPDQKGKTGLAARWVGRRQNGDANTDTDIRRVEVEENDHDFRPLSTGIFLSSSSLADMSPPARVGFLKRLPLLSGPNAAANPSITAVSTPPYHSRTNADPELGCVVGPETKSGGIQSVLHFGDGPRLVLHVLAGTRTCSADLWFPLAKEVQPGDLEIKRRPK
jgi:hypothetical protein